MRLAVFSPEISPQLLIDLGKIYQHYFTEDQLCTEYLQCLIEDGSQQLYVTRFNGRHLGALQVQVTDHQAQLSLLTVRDITRRRGVAKNLLSEVEKQLQSDGVEQVIMYLDEIKEEEKSGLSLFMLAAGYQLVGTLFTKAL